MSQLNPWTRLQAWLPTNPQSPRRNWCNPGLVVVIALLCIPVLPFETPGFAEESEFAGLIRSKTPDRGSYQSPTGGREAAKSKTSLGELETVEFQEFPESRDVLAAEPELSEPEFAEHEVDEPTIVRGRVRQVGHQTKSNGPRVSQASHGENILYEDFDESNYALEASDSGASMHGFEATCGCEAAGYACDGSCMSVNSCDSPGACGGCDSCGYGDCRPRLCLDPCQWFGSVELLMLWRGGEGLPPLATTSTTATGTGVLGAPGTVILFGDQSVLDNLTAGGRATVGTWLDDQQCRSLVVRGWGAEQDSYNFATNETMNLPIARPFLNVTDGVTPANGSQVIAAAGQRNGSINIDGENSVYGGDISLRQRWLGGLGGFVDVLYGYQYMRMEDSLHIATSSTVLSGQALPQGTIINVMDSFDAQNEFNGGQLGLAARYRERCWSFNGTIKAAAGSLQRTVQRDGMTTTSTGGVNASVPTGLLVRTTNDGVVKDNTFAWVPELDASIGWRWTKNLDLTFGYNLIAMTEAIQVAGAIDPNLAVNAADNPTGQQRPSAALRYNTFYMQGIHFGVQCVY